MHEPFTYELYEMEMTMEKDRMMTAEEVKESLSVSRTRAYQVIRLLNDELNAQGFKTIPGRVSHKYFNRSFFPANGDDPR